VLPQAEAKGSANKSNMLASLGHRLRQHSQLLTLKHFVKKQYFEKELAK
jgi:hypothetical protein